MTTQLKEEGLLTPEEIEKLYDFYTEPENCKLRNGDSVKRAGSLNIVSRKQQLHKVNTQNRQILKNLQRVKPTEGITGWRQHMKTYEHQKRQQAQLQQRFYPKRDHSVPHARPQDLGPPPHQPIAIK